MKIREERKKKGSRRVGSWKSRLGGKAEVGEGGSRRRRRRRREEAFELEWRRVCGREAREKRGERGVLGLRRVRYRHGVVLC
jgi:hypothetical protein